MKTNHDKRLSEGASPKVMPLFGTSQLQLVAQIIHKINVRTKLPQQR